MCYVRVSEILLPKCVQHALNILISHVPRHFAVSVRVDDVFGRYYAVFRDWTPFLKSVSVPSTQFFRQVQCWSCFSGLVVGRTEPVLLHRKTELCE